MFSALQPKSVFNRAKRFARGQAGNVAAITAISAVPLMLAGGAAVDYGNWVSVQARLQAAVDAAALATASEINRTDDELVTIGKKYFASNFGQPKNSDVPEVTLSISEGKVRVDASVDVDNYLMKIIGKEKQTIATYAEATLNAQKLHVVFAFDNTGSMASSKRLTTLKVAANDFVEILFGGQDEAPLHSDLMVGVVPFSQFVNVGPEKFGDQSITWLDHDGRNELSSMNFIDSFSAGPSHNKEAWDKVIQRRPELSWPGCVEARKGELAWRDDFVSTNPDHLFPYMFAPDEPGKASENQACFNDQGVRTNCGNDDKWVYYNNYLDDSLDDAPTTYTTDVKKMNWLQNDNKKYFRNRARVNTMDQGNERGPGKGCNIVPIRPLTNKKGPVLATIDSMVANGYTHISEGVAWAQRVLSPGQPFDESKNSGDDVTNVMIVLSDDENSIETKNKNHNLSTYAAYGFLKQANKRLGTSVDFGDDKISAQSSTWELANAALQQHNERTKAACEYAKDEGTNVFAFAFHVAYSPLLESCAGPARNGAPIVSSTSGEYFFKATSNSELMESFEALANDLRPPYLSQ